MSMNRRMLGMGMVAAAAAAVVVVVVVYLPQPATHLRPMIRMVAGLRHITAATCPMVAAEEEEEEEEEDMDTMEAERVGLVPRCPRLALALV